MTEKSLRIELIQAEIQTSSGGAWLFFDWAGRDPIAHRILGLGECGISTRRWFYCVPPNGEPTKIVHSIERNRLDRLPGRTITYSSWRSLHCALAETLKGRRSVFMQYSPSGNLPQVSLVDAGTVELIRGLGVDVLSSADLIQLFDARLDEEQERLHQEAGRKIHLIKDEAFEFIRNAVADGVMVSEFDVQEFIVRRFGEEGLTCDGHNPIVAVNDHAADPHYETTRANSYPIHRGDRVLIDLWARVEVPEGIYYDITWCGYVGEVPPSDYSRLFGIVVEARKRAKAFVAESFRMAKDIRGYEVDDLVRAYMREEGVADYFTHRTGHSIHKEVHGNGANLDNWETKDDRKLLPRTCFSIEPGIYWNGIGVRSEITVLVKDDGELYVVGDEQEELMLL